jgi:hypothetical protein
VKLHLDAGVEVDVDLLPFGGPTTVAVWMPYTSGRARVRAGRHGVAAGMARKRLA